MKHKKTTDKHICTIFDSVGVAWECVTCKKPSCTRCIENTEKVVQCEDGNPDCFHGGKAACTWCGTNNWDFNPKYNKNYCNRCGYAEDHPCSDLKPIELPSIADAVYFRMEQYGHTQREACEKMGIAFSHLNEAMKGKRRFSITQVKALYKYGIPAHVLLQ